MIRMLVDKWVAIHGNSRSPKLTVNVILADNTTILKMYNGLSGRKNGLC